MKKLYLFALNFFLFFPLIGQNYAVGHTTITFNDPTRSGGFGSGGGSGRQIQTEIYYPALSAGTDVALAPGEFPVIVFGHGFAMAWSAYQNVWEDLAPEGYILAFPRTEGNLLPAPSHQDFGLDLALVETRMQAENGDANSLFYQHVRSSSAIMGHSMGGGATFIGAANNNSPSLKAVVGLAPAETNPSAIAAASNVTHDVLIFSGSSDGVTPPSSNHQPIYNNAASNCKTFISITNGSHCYFANSNFNCDFGELTTGTGSLSRAEQQDITSDYLKLWLNFKLKNSCLAWDEFLDSLSASPRIIEQQQCSYAYLQPDVNLTGNTSFCQGTFSSLFATNNSNYSYEWYADNDTLSYTNDSIQVNTPGNYLVVASNNFGCRDTSNVLNLIENPSYNIRDTITACLGSIYIFPDGFTSNTDTTYTSVLQTNANCDSIIQRTVFFGSTVSGSATFNLCQGDTFFFNNVFFINDTLFNDTIANGSAFSCDSATSITVQFSAPDTTMINPIICENENYQLPSGLFVDYSDTFVFNYTNIQGCDSTFIIDLVVGVLNNNINLNSFGYDGILGDTFTVFASELLAYDSLAWTVSNGLQILSANQDSMTCLITGIEASYTINLNFAYQACSNQTSINLLSVGLLNIANGEAIQVYPNPCLDFLQVSGENIHEISIYDMLGKKQMSIRSEAIHPIAVHDLSPGWYILKTNVSHALFLKQ